MNKDDPGNSNDPASCGNAPGSLSFFKSPLLLRQVCCRACDKPSSRTALLCYPPSAEAALTQESTPPSAVRAV